MIKYNLKCKNKHEFESWFSNSNEFERLKAKNLLECIYCSSKDINKSIMSPRVLSSNNKNNQIKDDIKKFKMDLVSLRNFVEKNFEYVGKDFSKKIREVYYDKNNAKNIYGSTTKEERDELKEEGIELVSIPWIEKDN